MMWTDRAVTPGILPFFQGESLSAFVHSPHVGNRACFGFVAKMANGALVFAEYHGCGARAQIADRWRSDQPLTLLVPIPLPACCGGRW